MFTDKAGDAAFLLFWLNGKTMVVVTDNGAGYVPITHSLPQLDLPFIPLNAPCSFLSTRPSAL